MDGGPVQQSVHYDGMGEAIELEDVRKLSGDSGCDILTDKNNSFDFDDDALTDCDSDDGFNEELDYSKYNDLKHEYLSMVLNANRDPLEPGSGEQKPSVYREDTSEQIMRLDTDSGIETIEDKYSNIGKFDDVIGQQDSPFIEISPNRVYKRKINGGIEVNITESSVVAYNCALWTEGSAEPFDSTWLRNQAYVTDMLTDPLMPGLREILLTCKIHEWCECLIRPEAAFGKLGAMPRIPPNATIFCLIEIIKVVQRDQLPTISGDNLNKDAANGCLSFRDLFDASDLARKRGNYYYEQSNYKAALQRYRSGIRIIEATIYKNEDEEKSAKELLLKLYSNSARSCNRIGSNRLALTFCKEALMLDDTNLKVLYNKMRAWEGLSHYDRAIGVARRAMELSKDAKSYKSFERCKEELKIKLVEEERNRDNLYRLMAQAVV